MHERTLTGAVVPAVFLIAVAALIALFWWWLAMLALRAQAARSGLAEKVAAATLALSAVYIAFNESFANWQSLWLCFLLMLLSLSLLRFRRPPAVQS